MTFNKNFVEEFFNRTKNDPDYRAYILKNPNQAMAELHGIDTKSMPNVTFEIIEQEENTITILIPSKPEDYTPDQKSRAKKIADQTIDFMYERGIPGFLIPNDDLRWVLLNMRRSWLNKEGSNS